MSDSAIDIQPSPKNGKPPEQIHKFVKVVFRVGHFLRMNVWNPFCIFVIKVWKRIRSIHEKGEEIEMEPQSNTDTKCTSSNIEGDNVLVHRTNSTDTDEKIQSVERELSEISVMKISRSASIASLIREDYVDSTKE